LLNTGNKVREDLKTVLEFYTLVLSQPLEIVQLKDRQRSFRKLTEEVVDDLALSGLGHLVVAEGVVLVNAL